MSKQSERLLQLESLLTESPNDAFLLFAIAKEHEGLENYQKALECYQNLEIKHPDYVGNYYHLGKLTEHLVNNEAAIKIYEKGIVVAKAQNDRHAANELAGAKMEIDDND